MKIFPSVAIKLSGFQTIALIMFISSHLPYRKEDILLYRLVYAGFFLDAMSPRCLPARAHGRSLSFFFFFCSRERTINKESFSCSIHVQRNMAVFALKTHIFSILIQLSFYLNTTLNPFFIPAHSLVCIALLKGHV